MSKFAYQEILKNLRTFSEREALDSNQKRILCNNIEKLDTYSSRMEKLDQQNILIRPFPQTEIKHRKGYNGKQLAYIETHNVIERLNEAFNFQWSWQIIDYTVEEKQVYCRGMLTVSIDDQTVVKEGFGGKARSGEIGDDLKSASSDALKKASSLLGIGLHLYKGAGNNGRPAPGAVASRH